MRPLDYDDEFEDFDEFDELAFDSAAATRRIIGERHRQETKSGGRKHRRRTSNDRWNFAELDDYNDYDEDEFDEYYGSNLSH